MGRPDGVSRRPLVVGTYVVVYRATADTVFVMRVFQGARDYERLL
jgi:plasmid stabilization system protein ParE